MKVNLRSKEPAAKNAGRLVLFLAAGKGLPTAAKKAIPRPARIREVGNRRGQKGQFSIGADFRIGRDSSDKLVVPQFALGVGAFTGKSREFVFIGAKAGVVCFLQIHAGVGATLQRGGDAHNNNKDASLPAHTFPSVDGKPYFPYQSLFRSQGGP